MRFNKGQETSEILDKKFGTKIPVLGDIPISNMLL